MPVTVILPVVFLVVLFQQGAPGARVTDEDVRRIAKFTIVVEIPQRAIDGAASAAYVAAKENDGRQRLHNEGIITAASTFSS